MVQMVQATAATWVSVMALVLKRRLRRTQLAMKPLVVLLVEIP